MKAGRLLFWGGLGAILTLAALVFAWKRNQSGTPRTIEIWVTARDHPGIAVRAGKEFWSRGSDTRIFRATIGPRLAQNHTVLKGELAWPGENADQAWFTFTLSNEQPVTVVILGVTPADRPIAEENARRTIFYPPGKHSFRELLFVKYTYD